MLFLSTLALAPEAAADEPFTTETVQVSGHLNTGFMTDDGPLDPYVFGFGARGGYTFDFGLYVGANFDWFIGEGAFSLQLNIWDLTAEAGYDIGAGEIVVVRPQLGFGYSEGRGCSNLGCSSTGTFSLQPGVMVPISLEPVLLMPGFRMNVPSEDLSSNNLGFLFDLGVGVAF